MTRAAVLALLRFYKGAISPWLGVTCRHRPTCSEYAMEAVRVHGSLRGLGLAAARLWRCRPGGSAGYDPVPPRRA